MKRFYYVVTAYRYGNLELHSYVLGVYKKKHAAIKRAEAEESYRGGKYSCRIVEFEEGTQDANNLGTTVRYQKKGM